MPYPDVSKAEYLLRLLFPARCICCGAVLPFNTPEEICSDCKGDIKLLDMYEYKNPPGSSITRVFSVFEYEGGVRKAIHRLKFGETPHNAFVLADLSYLLLEEYFNVRYKCRPCSDCDIIIPAPLHPKRKRQRGYNQSELIASRLSFHMKIPMMKGVLVKKVNTPPQSRLGRAERLKNLIGVYYVRKPDLVKNRKILLVDDIMTTGSTLEQCGKVLMDAGARQVEAYVVAIRKRV